MGCAERQGFVFYAIFIVSHRPDYFGHRPSGVTYGAAGARAACLHCGATESTKKGPSSQLGSIAAAGGAAQPYCSIGNPSSTGDVFLVLPSSRREQVCEAELMGEEGAVVLTCGCSAPLELLWTWQSPWRLINGDVSF